MCPGVKGTSSVARYAADSYLSNRLLCRKSIRCNPISDRDVESPDKRSSEKRSKFLKIFRLTSAYVEPSIRAKAWILRV